MRETVRPPRRGCLGSEHSSPGLLKLHRWQYSTLWNGNNREVLPFWTGTRGISRSGWRCFKCGIFVWDQTDKEFALSFAETTGFICLPTDPRKH